MSDRHSRAPDGEDARLDPGDLEQVGFPSLVSAAPIVLFTLDREGVFTAAEGGDIAAVGIDIRIALGHSVFEIFRDNPEVLDHCRRALAGETFTVVSRVSQQSFETRYSPFHDSSGRLVGTIGAAVEVTAREHAIDELRASEERYRAFAEHAHDAIVEIDPQARILYASPRFAEITGYPDGEIVGKSGLDLVHPDDLAVVDEIRAESMANETAVEMSFRFRHKNGAWLWLELGGRPYRTSSGELRAVLLIRDVTERIRLERERLDQLELESRVGELSRQLLTLEHDDVEEGIQHGLKAAAAMGGADRCYVISTRASRGTKPFEFEWTGDGISRRSRVFNSKVIQRNPWTARRLIAGDVIRTPVVADLPDEARHEREGLMADGVRSALLIPVRSGPMLIGVLGFHCIAHEKHWSDHEVYVLRLVAELFSSALRRKDAEAAFFASEDRFRALAENADDSISEIGEDGRIQYANPSFQNLLGYTLDELREMPPFELVHPDDRERMQQMYRYASAEPGASGTTLYRARHRDGTDRWLEASGRGFTNASTGFRMVAVIRDVTERQRNQRALERQLELEKQISLLSRRFLALATGEIDQGIRDGVAAVGELAEADRCYLIPVTTDGQESLGGSYAWHRSGIASSVDGVREFRMSGYGSARDILQRAHVFHVPRIADLPPEAREEGAVLGRRGVQSFLGIPLASEHGLVGFMGFEALRSERTWDDETIRLLRLAGEIFVSALNRKRAEEALAESQAQLLQAQKMEAVGTLAGGVAHDFNNQLAVILGNARHLLRRVEDEPDLRDPLVDLERAAEHCAQLTRALLAFSRQTPTESRPIDTVQALLDFRELLAPLIPTSIEFAVQAAHDVDWLSADPTQLQQVLVNLAVNARDAMPEGGRLEIRAANRRVTAEEATRLGLPSAGRYVEISVRDDGIGMEERTRSRIFDPFFTTKAPGKGTGLGLATAYGIVRESGGAIAVESEPGEGTTFRVLLPGAVTAELAEDDSADVDVRAGSETVLLVEDEPRVRRLVHRMLTDRGYRVHAAADGIDALQISQDHEGEIHIVVTDIVMPNLSGVVLAERLRLNRPDLRVLFISGYSQASPDIENSRLLEKPFTEPELLTAVRKLLDH